VSFTEIEGMYKEFEGKWCWFRFEDDRQTILKIIKVSGDSLLCENVRGARKLISIYDIRNVEEFSGVIHATKEHVQNGVVVSVQKAIQDAK